MSWTWRIKPTTSFDRKRVDGFLLTEAFDFLVQEDGWLIKLEEYWIPNTTWNWRIIP